MDVKKVKSITNKGGNKKKRLNLEEYRKCRMGGSVPKPESHHVFQVPQAPDSPDTKARKYREMMDRMAMEVLKATPKSQMAPERRALELPDFVVPVSGVKPVPVPYPVLKPARIPVLQPAWKHFLKKRPTPADMEMKVSVNVGMNTESMRRKNLDLTPAKQVAAHKPLLQREKTKINADVAPAPVRTIMESRNRKRKRSISSSSEVSSSSSGLSRYF